MIATIIYFDNNQRIEKSIDGGYWQVMKQVIRLENSGYEVYAMVLEDGTCVTRRLYPIPEGE